ncbi:MAG: hypothetical protein ACI39R_05780 [Lachnospiraceae bacterium]
MNLLYPDRDTPGSYIYPDSPMIIKDFNFQLIFDLASRSFSENGRGFASASEAKDTYIKEAMRKVMMTPVTDRQELLYRQEMVKAAVKNEKLYEGLYAIAVRAEKTVSEHFAGADKLSKGGISTVEKLKYLRKLTEYLDEIKILLDATENEPAIEKAFSEFKQEYTADFQEVTNEILDDLEFITSGGKLVLTTGHLDGLKAERYFIEHMEVTEFKVRKKPKTGALAKVKAITDSIINPDIKELKSETLVADAALLQNAACDYILSFYEEFMKTTGIALKNLKLSSAFYLGTIRLYNQFKRFDVPLCFPEVCERKDIYFEDLCETCLCIYQRKRPVGNSVCGDGKQIILVTGANQGGKSTFLRSIGIAQVFMQAGMFVTAESFKSGLYQNIFTHFTRREDSTMNSGRLDEELKRMSQIITKLTPDSMMLLNESFATTTEKEGSVIAEELTEAVLKTEVRMFCVTHLLEYAHSCYDKKHNSVLFLSAERRPDGTRSYKMVETPPSDTSYGLDLYDALIR